MTNVVHGGNLDEMIARHGGERADWLDLSTGISPFSYPLPELPTDVWSALPDAKAEQRCEQAARRTWEIQDRAKLVLAPGSQSLLQILPYLFVAQPVSIVGYTYQEHGVCWQRAGHEVYVTDGLESAEATARIVVLVNPNNPDGATYAPEQLEPLARRLGAKGGLLVVDEAFSDVAPELSLAPLAGGNGLLVLKSLGKFYGLAGIRLGFGISSNQLGERLAARLGPWSVSGPALAIGAAALGNRGWQTRTRGRLEKARQEMQDILAGAGFEILGGTDLFVLARHGEAQNIALKLAEKRIHVRTFPAHNDWIRFGLVGRAPERKRLVKALADTI